MIIFATNHDESTAASFNIAKLIIEKQDVLILEDAAIRTNLIDLLSTNRNQPLIIFSHGKDNCCIGNNDKPALTMSDIDVLSNRKTYSYACWRAKTLGQMVAKQSNSLYAGYNNIVITGGVEISDDMRKIFMFIKTEFPKIHNKQSAMLFLEELNQLCTSTEQGYLQRYPESLNYIGISTALRNIWAKLEICSLEQKYAHHDAIEAPLW